MKTVTGSIPEIILNKEGLYEGDLKHYFQVLFNEARNLQNGYHNFCHMLHVLFRCYQAIRFYGDRITKLEARALLIAALFHDFNHPGRTGNDDMNIMLALRSLKKHLLESDKPLFKLIIELIQSTEFPHKIPGEKLTLLAQILRDADMCQALSVSWIQQVIFGLAQEMGTTPRVMLEMQGKFLSSQKFITDWAQAEFPQSTIDAKISEAESLLECLA